jgi:CMP-N,N'-diacetyllegionaminic acid synthase
MADLSVVCIIPARGGSKGIPNKNLVPLAGKPLVAWSVAHGLASQHVDGAVYVSSDDDEILGVATQHGGRAIRRPAALATDSASSEDALKHALATIAAERTRPIDLVVFLQPTSPVRADDDIDRAIERLRADNADSLLSVRPLRDYFIWERRDDGSCAPTNFDYQRRKRRQDLPTTYLENGSIYVFKPSVLVDGNNRLGGRITVYEMDAARSHQIDNPEDLELCEYFLRKRAP